MLKLSKKLRSRQREFKISKRSAFLLRHAGVTSICYSNGYAHVNYQGRGMRLHSLLMILLGHDLKGMEVDHKNRNKLDNLFQHACAARCLSALPGGAIS